jgi:hypothetical protein
MVVPGRSCSKNFFGFLFSIEKKIEKTLLTMEAYKGTPKSYLGKYLFCSDIPLPQQVFLS